MNNYDITDEQWKRLEPLLPPENTGKKGRPRKDNRMMLNGMLWMNHSGAQWRQLPKRYGPWQSVYARFAKWRDDGIWERIFSELNKEVDTERIRKPILRISVLIRRALRFMRALMVRKKGRIKRSD